MDQPKTRQEKGKGKGAKTKQEFNQRTIRQKEALLNKGLERVAVAVAAPAKRKWTAANNTQTFSSVCVRNGYIYHT